MAYQDLGSDPCPAAAFLIRGKDALTFAQKQFSSNVAELNEAGWQWSAWLDVTGKVRMLCMLIREDQSLCVLMRGGDAHETCASLARYVMRARVELEVLDGWFLIPGAELAAQCVDRRQHELRLGMGARSLTLSDRPGSPDAAKREAFVLADIRAGFPWLPRSAINAWLPPALGLHRLAAVSTSKGCYPGQEIVARMHHRGSSKFRLARLRNTEELPVGVDIIDKHVRTGMILGKAADQALATIHINALENAPEGRLLQIFPD